MSFLADVARLAMPGSKPFPGRRRRRSTSSAYAIYRPVRTHRGALPPHPLSAVAFDQHHARLAAWRAARAAEAAEKAA